MNTSNSPLDRALLVSALRNSPAGLHPRRLAASPVMFVTWLAALLTTLEALRLAFVSASTAPGEAGFTAIVAALLWLTVWFGALAESLAEVRGRAQAASLRASRQSLVAKRLSQPQRDAERTEVAATELHKGDHVLVEAGDWVPADGTVVSGAAAVDESAVTGESAPVIREAGGDRSAVTGGTRVLSDWLVVRVTANPGEAFLDRMIAMVEGAARRRTPNEIALSIVLTGFTLGFLVVCVTLGPIADWFGVQLGIATLAALFVCLAPTTIGALLSAIGIAGMTRLARHNVLATSGRAVEAAGDVDVLLLDKTGTITLGNRRATRFVPAAGVDVADLARAAQLASLGDETPEGRSIVVLAKEEHGLRGQALAHDARVVAFSAETRMSGLDLGTRLVRKGAVDAVRRWLRERGCELSVDVQRTADEIASKGGTPLVVAEFDGSVARDLGVVQLVDIVKGGVRERFAELRRMGIRTVMITGDNPRTAASIAAEAGVDDFLAEATPEAKLALIRQYQSEGHLVAMTGDGTNDAPALAQADVAVAMQSGTQAAKEAGNMVDLDSDPTKLLDIVVVGKQLLMTRGALTTFSLANDIAKYFAIVPALFAVALPSLAALDVMNLASPRSAILSALVFNALVIPALVPLALRGVRQRAASADAVLARNLLVFGLGGVVVPFVGIKAIDVVVAGLGLA